MTFRPRIRTLKPETWADEKVGTLSRDARLLFVGLVTMADDEGRLRALPAAIIGHVFPYDDDVTAAKLAKWMRELESCGLVQTYESGGRPYAALPGWVKHQKVNRSNPSELPPPPDTSVSVNGHDRVTESSVNEYGRVSDSAGSHAQAGAIADRDQDQDHPPKPPRGQSEQGRVITFRRRPVTDTARTLAEAILADFNQQAGTTYSPYTAAGAPTEDLKRILGALSDTTPPITLTEAAQVTRWRLAHPFWEGRPHTGVVFGPNVFPSNRESARNPAPNNPSSTDIAAALHRAHQPTTPAA